MVYVKGREKKSFMSIQLTMADLCGSQNSDPTLSDLDHWLPSSSSIKASFLTPAMFSHSSFEDINHIIKIILIKFKD